MKKIIALLMIFTTFQLCVNAQKLYFKGQAGYDFGFLKSQTNFRSDKIVEYYDSITYKSSYQSYKNSYATGVSLNAGLGIMITKCLSAELTGIYTVCLEQKFDAGLQMQNETGYHFEANSHYTMKGNYIGIKPSLTFTLPGKDFRPYARVGAILSLLKMKERMNMNVFTDSPNYIPYDGMEYTLEYKKRLSAGVNVSLGLEYMILNRLWLYGEVEATIVNYFPAGATYTNYVVSRQDVTDQLTVHEREITYVESYSDTDNNSADEPTKMLPVHYSFSTIGFNIGLKYTLFD